MIRESNESQGRASEPSQSSVQDELRRRFGPRRDPSGTDNFANLLRDPSLVLGELVAEELARSGFADLRPALLAVGAHFRADGVRITELAERAQLTKATVVHTVDELERLGYARRISDPSDGRAKLVVPTERAIAAERAGREAIAQVHAAWTQLLGASEMQRLERSLRHLRAVLWGPPGDPGEQLEERREHGVGAG
jgi:DNA-binding MarR family transcriptional regulator